MHNKDNTQTGTWNYKELMKLQKELDRVQHTITEAKREMSRQWGKSSMIAKVKRATLDFNDAAIRLRKGEYQVGREESDA